MRDRLGKRLTQHAITVVGIYIAISVLWILLSDHLVTVLFDANTQTTAQSYKGIFFVLATAGFLYLLIGRKNISIKQLFERSRNKMKIFQDTFEQAAVGIAHLSPDGEWIRVNYQLCEMLGYNKRELKSLTLADIVHPDDLEKGKKEDRKLLSGDSKSYVMKKRYITKNDEVLFAKITKSCIYDGKKSPEYLIAIIEDITDEQKATEKLKETIEQKDLLIREIHHRVKNNLAIISGLLELQAFNAEDVQVQKLLKDSMMRIKSIALIHESFYQSDKISYVAFEKYLEDFVEHITAALDIQDKKIDISLNSEPVKVNINQAMPLGLMINELVINAYVHAFNNRSEGEIAISLAKNEDTVMLKVKDNGKGLPANFNLENNTSFGTTILRTLSMQLQGDLRYESYEGTEVSISFKKEEKSGSSSAVSAHELL